MKTSIRSFIAAGLVFILPMLSFASENGISSLLTPQQIEQINNKIRLNQEEHNAKEAAEDAKTEKEKRAVELEKLHNRKRKIESQVQAIFDFAEDNNFKLIFKEHDKSILIGSFVVGAANFVSFAYSSDRVETYEGRDFTKHPQYATKFNRWKWARNFSLFGLVFSGLIFSADIAVNVTSDNAYRSTYNTLLETTDPSVPQKLLEKLTADYDSVIAEIDELENELDQEN